MKFSKFIFIILLSLYINPVLAAETNQPAKSLKVTTPNSFLAENPSSERKDIVEFLIAQFANQSAALWG